ncbi:heparin-binding hemagglutinin [Mycolicibacterium phocaicum]|uniref:heparin-binding hemagglutinin n=1 Tax=Mycolicibacterium phocaicum TaxID=319706 RepID=UPI001CFBA42C|nr:heparin-binding hemagglutinin [Mycolicibacterium phocaicum]UCZ59711.1 heparin-binding hemagglutinin [Mycolicibacterium phocaicum]
MSNGSNTSHASLSLDDLAVSIREFADNPPEDTDWMTAVNMQSLTALSDLVGEAASRSSAAEMSEQKSKHVTVGDLTAPILAVVGAADLAFATANDILASLRDQVAAARSDAEARLNESRARLAKLQEGLLNPIGELRGWSNAELRKASDSYADQAQLNYDKLVERGEAALERLRNELAHAGTAGGENATEQAARRTQDAPGSVTARTRSVDDRGAKPAGVELAPKTAPARKATPIKKEQ